jgi:aspartyl-tRNA(Asn)/glutamyl-tRNA(Gln) amidotransferase subunit A
LAELWELSLADLTAVLRGGEISVEDACHAFVSRAAEVHERVNCFIELDEAAALGRARQLDRLAEPDRGPLHGVPFAAKDIFVEPQRSPTVGVRHMQLRLRAGGAAALERAEAAGAMSLGRLNLDPWGYATTGANAAFGATLNPWDPSRMSGGSSSGAAAAVAARALPFAIGGDTGGSVRIPAALCGVVGLKPTFGRISRRGAVPLSYSQDTVGILARSALDIALVLDQVAGFDRDDPATLDVPSPAVAARVAARAAGDERPLRGLRVGIDRARLEDARDPEAVKLVEATLDVLTELGAVLVELELTLLDRCDVAASVLTQAESASLHGAAFLDSPSRYPPAVARRLSAAFGCLGSDHVDALRLQGRALRELLDGPLAAADLIVGPAAPGTPPRLDTVTDASPDEALELSLALLRLHRPLSFTGVPAMSLPVGFDSGGLPVGVQLAARPWAEGLLLECAAAYQSVTDWHLRAPLQTTDQGAL